MSGTGIVHSASERQVESILRTSVEEYSPLRQVMPHVQAKAIGVAVAILGTGFEVKVSAVVFEAEKWLVQKYVGEDFCGLCGRSTDHRGEH